MNLAAVAALHPRLNGKITLGFPAEGREAAPSAFLGTGLPDLDRFFGGFPRGRLCELVGAGSSGKLTLALGALRHVLSGREPGLAALVDLSRAVFPAEPWAVGRLLVIRPPTAERALRALDVLVGSGLFAAVVLEASGAIPPRGVEAVEVRMARLARETGTTVVCCADRSLFRSHSALRLEVDIAPEGWLRVDVRKNRQGAVGSVAVELPCFPFPPQDPRPAPARRPLKVA